MTAGPCLLAALRSQGATIAAVGDRLHVRAPRGLVSPELREALAANKPAVFAALAAEERVLNLHLSEFARAGRPLETRVPWWPDTIWFVPAEAELSVLLARGIHRGRIWTAGELEQIAGLDDLPDTDLRTLGRIKAQFGATVVEVVSDQSAFRPRRCWACLGDRSWHHVDGRVLCATCHPPSNPENIAEWIEPDPEGER